MPVGKVIFFNQPLKYGFIRCEPCNVFFHRDVVEGDLPSNGEMVRYEAVDAGRSSPQATTVRKVDSAVIAEADRVFGAA